MIRSSRAIGMTELLGAFVIALGFESMQWWPLTLSLGIVVTGIALALWRLRPPEVPRGQRPDQRR